MTIAPAKLTDPTVRAFVTAINAGDREAFFHVLAPDATMSDDGSDRDLDEWVDREIFGPNGRMDVQSESSGGHALVANFTNETWGEMRTAWRFTVDGGRISRFETGQA
ncbi:nuclear transport factor 2 family protein [Kitasatospora aureofaciens]|uniref:nuclear transport factor 2 family protein n=1 Tax=Kitasatospora aureofaciens TaxID=1894 RepID=UPI0036F4669C